MTWLALYLAVFTLGLVAGAITKAANTVGGS